MGATEATEATETTETMEATESVQSVQSVQSTEKQAQGAGQEERSGGRWGLRLRLLRLPGATAPATVAPRGARGRRFLGRRLCSLLRARFRPKQKEGALTCPLRGVPGIPEVPEVGRRRRWHEDADLPAYTHTYHTHYTHASVYYS